MVEVSDTTLDHDLGPKVGLYGRAGIIDTRGWWPPRAAVPVAESDRRRHEGGERVGRQLCRRRKRRR